MVLHRLVCVLLLCLAPTAYAAPGGADQVRLELSGSATPYAKVTYEVAPRRGAVIVGVRKAFAEGFGHRDEVGLLTAEDLDALLAELDAMGAFALPPRTSKSRRARWTLTIRWGDKRRVLTIDDPGLADDLRYRALVDRVVMAVEAELDPILFRDPMLLPGEAGRLRLSARPPARVAINGLPVEGKTPMNDLRLPVGTHTITLTPVSGGDAHPYEVRIEAGKTTSLAVELR